MFYSGRQAAACPAKFRNIHKQHSSNPQNILLFNTTKTSTQNLDDKKAQTMLLDNILDANKII